MFTPCFIKGIRKFGKMNSPGFDNLFKIQVPKKLTKYLIFKGNLKTLPFTYQIVPLLRKGGGVAGVTHLNSVFSNMDEIFFYLNDNVNHS